MIVKKSTYYISGDLLPKAIAFFIIPILTHILSTDEYGIIVYINSLFIFITPFFSLGSITYLFKTFNINANSNIRNLKVINTLFWGLIMRTLVLSILFYVLFSFIPFSTQIKTADYALYIVAIAFFSSLNTIPMGYLRVQGKAKEYFFFTLLVTVLENIAIFCLIVNLSLGVKGWFLGRIIANVIYFVVILFFFRKIIFKSYFNRTYFKESILFGIPFTIGTFIFVLNDVTDRFILEKYVTLKELGLYGLAYSISFVLQNINNGVAKAMQPNIIQTAKENKGDNLYNILIEYKKIVNLVTFSTTILFVISCKFLFQYFINETFIKAFDYVIFLCIAPIFIAQFNIYSSVLVASGQKKYYITSAAIGLIINIIFNLILIPHLGVYGAVIATIASYIAILIMGYIEFKKIIKFNFFDRSLYFLSLLLTITIFVVYFNFFNNTLIKYLSIISIISTLIVYIVYILNLKENERLGKLLREI